MYNITNFSVQFQACAANGIKVAVLTGQIAATKRDRIIHDFTHLVDPECRVLFMSQVGMTGLNLTECSILIHYDSLWSGVEQTQIDGRIWRYGQTRAVDIYHLVAVDTADLYMMSTSAEKSNLLHHFADPARSEGMTPLPA